MEKTVIASQKSGKSAREKCVLQGIKDESRGLLGTLKKISWPAPKKILKDSATVLLLSAVTTVAVWLLDLAFTNIFQALLNLIGV